MKKLVLSIAVVLVAGSFAFAQEPEKKDTIKQEKPEVPAELMFALNQEPQKKAEEPSAPADTTKQQKPEPAKVMLAMAQEPEKKQEPAQKKCEKKDEPAQQPTQEPKKEDKPSSTYVA